MSAPHDNLIRPLLQPNAPIPSLRRSLLSNSIIFPLSADDVELIIGRVFGDLVGLPFLDLSRLERFIFLPRAVNDTDRQNNALRYLIRWSGSNKLSFHFVADLNMRNVTNVSFNDFLYGAGRIDILNELVLPNVMRLHFLDGIFSGRDLSEFLAQLPEAAFEGIEDVDITFLGFLDSPSTFGVRACVTFTSVGTRRFPPSKSCHLRNGFHPQGLKLPWRSMTLVDMGDTVISQASFLIIMQLSCDSLIDGSFHVVFATPLTLPHPPHIQPVVIMRSLINLHLRLKDTCNDLVFLLHFHLPILKNLWLEYVNVNFPFQWDIPLLTHLLAPASHTLETLFLTDLPVYSAQVLRRSDRVPSSHFELEALLRTLPNLKALWLPPAINVALPVLVDIEMGVLLPRLDFIEVAAERDPDNVFNMVRTRNAVEDSTEGSGRSRITAFYFMVPWPVGSS